MSERDSTGEKTRRKLPPAMEAQKWKPGVSPNPAGRPKGSRNKLGEEFVAALLADFNQHGPAVIESVRADQPAQYLKVIAQVIPKEVNVSVGQLEELSDEQLANGIRVLESILASQGMADGGEEAVRH
jgi:hypothetical protein